MLITQGSQVRILSSPLPGCSGDVAQWESSAFARRRSRVQIPPSPLSLSESFGVKEEFDKRYAADISLNFAPHETKVVVRPGGVCRVELSLITEYVEG